MIFIAKFLTCINLSMTSLLLVGCQSVATVAVNSETTEQPSHITLEQANNCNKILNNSSVGQIIFKQIFYSDVVAPEKIHLKTLNKTLNEEQISTLQQFIIQNHECRSLRLQAFREYEFRLALKDYFDEMDLLFMDMISQTKTIAQGNAMSEQIIQRYRSTIRQIIQRSRFIDEDTIA